MVRPGANDERCRFHAESNVDLSISSRLTNRSPHNRKANPTTRRLTRRRWMQKSAYYLSIAAFLVIGALCVTTQAQDKKLTLDELVAHHLDSIGSAQARAAAKNRVVSGTVKLVSRVGTASNI